jgi:hypothetical protein
MVPLIMRPRLLRRGAFGLVVRLINENPLPLQKMSQAQGSSEKPWRLPNAQKMPEVQEAALFRKQLMP